VRLNGVCFTLNHESLSLELIQDYLTRLKESGAVFLTPTVYYGTPAIRISITNWRTTEQDVVLAMQALQETALALHG
jgi:7-keto-8-aminopelargonate synthetase-like enzyme